jgi:hypothetical protein
MILRHQIFLRHDELLMKCAHFGKRPEHRFTVPVTDDDDSIKLLTTLSMYHSLRSSASYHTVRGSASKYIQKKN